MHEGDANRTRLQAQLTAHNATVVSLRQVMKTLKAEEAIKREALTKASKTKTDRLEASISKGKNYVDELRAAMAQLKA